MFMRKFVILLFIMLISVGVYAQSADVITQILETEKVSYGQVCYLSAVRQNLISEDDSFDDALAALEEKNQLNTIISSEYEANVQDIANIFMQIWPEVKGGLLYRLTHSSRYAFKHLKALRIIPDSYYPDSSINGLQLLNMLTSCMNTFGSSDECMTMEIE